MCLSAESSTTAAPANFEQGNGMNKLGWIIVLAGGMALLTGGCQADKKDKDAQAQGKPPIDTKFETMQDPPIKAKTHLAAGQLAESQGKLNKAIEQYWEAVRQEPKYKEPLFRLGVVY